VLHPSRSTMRDRTIQAVGAHMQFRSILTFTMLTCAAFGAGPANAEGDADRIRALEAKLAAQEARLAELERLLRISASASAPGASPALPAAPPSPARQVAPVGAPSPAQRPRIDVSGDLRLREEFNWSDADAPDRTRTVMRARLRASHAVNEIVTVGAQLSTGDPGDPNTTDFTVGDFVNDFNVSLDQLYAQVRLGEMTLWGGKFANPFRRTDLVWDGDVATQGVAAMLSHPIGGGARLDARALYFILNEAVAGKGSDMLGGQLALSVPAGAWNVELAGAYYDYRLRSVAGADNGDFRSNWLRPDGRYRSDFNLADGIAAITYRGLAEQWPVGVVAEYVHNIGAVDAGDGYSIELFTGHAARRGDWRLTYDYAVAQNEAVLAAFSHDNLGLATNYRLHALSVDHVVRADTILNLTLYHYRPADPLHAGASQPADWRDRLRLNVLFNF
jgi:hypothetical protein